MRRSVETCIITHQITELRHLKYKGGKECLHYIEELTTRKYLYASKPPLEKFDKAEERFMNKVVFKALTMTFTVGLDIAVGNSTLA